MFLKVRQLKEVGKEKLSQSACEAERFSELLATPKDLRSLVECLALGV